MSLKFRNRNSVSVNNRVWTAPSGKRFTWNSATTLLDTYIGMIQDYCRMNGLAVPGGEDIENLLCSQSPSRDCTGDPNYHMPNERIYTTQEVRSGGCKSCGRG